MSVEKSMLFAFLVTIALSSVVWRYKPAGPEVVAAVAESDGLWALERRSPDGPAWLVSNRPLLIRHEAELRMGDLDHPCWDGRVYVSRYSVSVETNGDNCVRWRAVLLRGDSLLIRRIIKAAEREGL